MATWYISPTGNDTTGNGTLANPYQSIGKVDTVCVNGDTIILMDGTYTAAMWSVAMTHNATFQAQHNNLAILTGNGTLTFPGGGAVNNYVIGLIWQNCGTLGSPLATLLSMNGNAYLTNCIIRNCVFTNVGEVLLLNGNFVISLTGCLVTGITRSSGTPIFTYGPSSLFTLQLHSCAFYNSEAVPMSIGYNVGGVTLDVKSCIFYTVNSVQFIAFGSVSGTFNNNCTFNFTGVPSGTGNITSDPLLVDAANANFNLRPTSPCLGTGVIV